MRIINIFSFELLYDDYLRDTQTSEEMTAKIKKIEKEENARKTQYKIRDMKTEECSKRKDEIREKRYEYNIKNIIRDFKKREKRREEVYLKYLESKQELQLLKSKVY